MSMNDTYQPINCDDYDNLDLVSRKNVEYLVVEAAGETRELRLDKITSFSHPEIGTVVVSES